MQLKPEDVHHLARLARIAIDDTEVDGTLTRLNQMFSLIEKMQAADTSGLEPMTHPQTDPLRLREDKPTEADQRSDFQAVAPSVAQGLYLVPKVIE